MIWKFILIWSIVSIVAAFVFGQLIRTGSGKPSNWQQYLPWRLTAEIESNHDLSVFFPVMALGAEVAIFLILTVVTLCLYLL